MTLAVPDERARIPRPVALLIVGAIAAATLLALFWPTPPWISARQAVVGPTKVAVVVKQVDNGGAARINELAPDFEWIAPDGTRVSLASLKKPVVLNFWATWCEPCKREMPLLDQTAAANPEIAFLAADLGEDGEKIRAFFDRFGIARIEPVLDVDLATARRYGVASVPSTFFIDAGGTIRDLSIGQMDEEKVARGLDRIK